MPAFLAPYTYVPDPTGDRALFLGEAFFGRPNTDPLIPANRITVRKVEADGSFTDLSQPITIGLGGVVMVDGSPAQLDIVETNYAVLIRDRQNVQQYFFPSAGPGGTSGREVLLSQGGLPFDDTLTTTGPTLAISAISHTNALILVDASGGAVTLNLPTVSLTGAKFRFIAKKIDSSSNTVTLDAAAADLIDGEGIYVLRTQNEGIEVTADGGSRWSGTSIFIPGGPVTISDNDARSRKNQRQVRNVFQRVDYITASNSAYAPTRNGRAKRLIVQGAGGDGANNGGGGGAGGQSIVENITLATTDSLNLTIGLGGSATITRLIATIDGRAVSMAANPGQTPADTSAGAGGTASGGDFNLTGGSGGSGFGGGGGGIPGFSPFTSPPFRNNGFRGGNRTGGGGGGGGAGVAGRGTDTNSNNGGGGGGTAPWTPGVAEQMGGPSAPFENMNGIMPALTGTGGNGCRGSGESGGSGGRGAGGGGAFGGGGFGRAGRGGFGGGGGSSRVSQGGDGGQGAGGGSGTSGGSGGDGFIMIIWDESE